MTPLQLNQDDAFTFSHSGQAPSPEAALAAELDELDRRLERAATHCDELARSASGSESPHVQRKVLHLRARLEGMRQQLAEARAGFPEELPERAPIYLSRGPYHGATSVAPRPSQIRRLAGAITAEP